MDMRALAASFSFFYLALQGVALADQKLQSTNELALWDRNYRHAATLKFVSLALSKVEGEFGPSRLNPSVSLDREQAFDALLSGSSDIDLVVSGMNYQWEEVSIPVLFPVERGMLGIRLCLVHPRHASLFESINTIQEFSDANIHILAGAGWPDNLVLAENGAKVTTFSNTDQILTLMQSSQPFCFSRGINEIAEDAARYKELMVEPRIAILYPQADVVYVNANKSRWVEALTLGFQRAWHDGSYMALFNELYSEVLFEYDFYQRKLMFLEHPQLTAYDQQILNEYGVASFVY